MTQREDDKLLRALLGPKDPELSCEQCFEELDRYVELEVAGADADAAIPGMQGAPRRLPGLSRGPRQPAELRQRRFSQR